MKYFPINRIRAVLAGVFLLMAAAADAGIYDDILAATERGDTPAVIDLLQRGMDVNTVDPAGNTLLMLAARNGNLSLTEFLLKNRANPLRRNRHGDTALMLAVYRGDAVIAEQLIAAGAEIGHSGWNPLHYAAFNGHVAAMQLLLKHKPDLDLRAPNGQTALMLAAANGHLDIVRLLIDADADIDLEDGEGRSALDFARKANHRKLVEFLLQAGAVED
jgi:ankyrin repeat protein